MQDAEGRVVVAGDHDQLLIRAHAYVAPDEKPVFGDPCRCNIARLAVERPPHSLRWVHVAVPVSASGFAWVPLPHWKDAFLNPAKRLFVQRRFVF